MPRSSVWIGSDRPIPVTIGHGWHSIGLPLLVTKTDGLVVEEIAGRPAREVFDENIRHGNTDNEDGIRAGGYYSTHAFGLIEPDGSHLIRGVYMTADRIHTFAPLPVYSAVQVMGCNPDDLLKMSHDVAERAVADRDPSVLLVFSCIARLDILKDRGRRGGGDAAGGRRRGAGLRRLHLRRVRADNQRGRLSQRDRRRDRAMRRM